VTDENWFSPQCEAIDVSERIVWLGKAKTAMGKVPERMK
jgi:hypothetical protein